MNRYFPEGMGLDAILGAHGPSWRCADDQDTTIAGNATNNCAASDLWGMTSSVPNPLPYVSTVTDTEPLFTATTTQARFNVTADVQAFLNGNPNYGWIVMGNTSASSGTSVNFGSRETEKAPVLRLTLTGSNCGDRDGDGLSDTDETNDGDGWTDPDVFNGMQARWKDHCHATPTCNAIDTVAEVNACTTPAPRETKTQAGGWNWQNPTSADICSPGYGFHPNWSVCDTDWQVDFQGFIELDNGGQHCFRVTSDTTGACGSAFFNNATTGLTSASGAQCFNVAAGVYPIRWFYETSGGPKTNFKVSYCHGGSQTCTPTVSVPSRMLRTQAPTCNPSNCGDGNVCNGVETCVSGSCVPGTPPIVDDQNPCTTDACHPTNGVTHTPVANGTSCEDGNLCTNSSACQAGSCVGGNPVVCTALDQCHDAGTCNPGDRRLLEPEQAERRLVQRRQCVHRHG